MKKKRWTLSDKRLLKQLVEDRADMNTMILELDRAESSVRNKLKKSGYKPKTIWIKEYDEKN